MECRTQTAQIVMFADKYRADQEFADIVEICQQQGYIKVKDIIRKFGVTRYHANKVLNDLCEEPAARMYATKEGPVTIYRLRKKE